MSHTTDSVAVTDIDSQRSHFTHGAILRRMLNAIALQAPDPDQAQSKPLAALTTRDTDDPAIALLDAWAMTLDVLSFYQQRLNDENYLGTATEQRSLRELARATGYELSPGLAASTYLAFSVDDNAAGGVATVTMGTAVQSIPKQDTLPQTFETQAELLARLEWNELQAYQARKQIPQQINGGTQRLRVQGIDTALQIGDPVLLLEYAGAGDAAGDWQYAFLLTVQAVDVDRENQVTTLEYRPAEALSADDAVLENITTEFANPQLFALRKKTACFGHNAPRQPGLPAALIDGEGAPYSSDWDVDVNVPTVWENSQQIDDRDNAQIYLDQSVAKAVPGSWALLSVGATQRLYQIDRSEHVSLADYGMSGRVTALTFPALADKSSDFTFRSTVVYVESEGLSLHVEERPTDDRIQSEEIELDTIVPGLEEGHAWVIRNTLDQVTETVSVESAVFDEEQAKLTLNLVHEEGQPAILYDYVPDTLTITAPGLDDPIRVTLLDSSTLVFNAIQDPQFAAGLSLTLSGFLPAQSEMFRITGSADIEDHTHLYLSEDLHYSYAPATAVLYANVVAATHGESVTEVLGDGNGTLANQRFTLSKAPLSYLPGATQTGVASTLSIRVNDVLWQETPSLFQSDANSQHYTIRLDEDDQITIMFGDGKKGARLPSGQENIQASYRVGIGDEGEVAPDSLILLQNRALGIKAVTNPVAANGAANPGDLDAARFNAPLNVLTIDRVVSLRDYQHFAQAYTGIAKAQAQILQQSQQSVLQLTIAGEDGDAVEPGSLLYDNLRDTIESVRSPGQILNISSYTSRQFNLSAKLLIDENYIAESVSMAVTSDLQTVFALSQRDFAQAVTAADVIQVIQAVDGVLAVDLDLLYDADDSESFNPILTAETARVDDDEIKAAELLTINPAGIQLQDDYNE
ncbi:MAG: hypothetical protein V3T17_10830 [Pseudomonadales bacterium]